ncbi:uncharacterized protein LOC135153034 [Daucus carota subsp. sativus]|uniref:uncharacterized protein LOC135153034 n=1 Tax=Daucus carota subsp. sativus TaxID=79200 RepID=UPI00308344D1
MSKQYRGVKMEKSLLLFILIVTSACVVESYVNETAALYAFDEMPSSVSCDSMRDVPVELRKELRKKMRSSLVALRKKLRHSVISYSTSAQSHGCRECCISSRTWPCRAPKLLYLNPL